MPWRNEEFYQKFRQYMIDGLGICRRQVEAGQIPGALPNWLSIFPRSTTIFAMRRFLSSIDKELDNLDSFKSCLNTLKTDPLFCWQMDTLVSNGIGAIRVSADGFLNNTLSRYLESVTNAEFREEVFQGLYKES